MAVEPLLLAEEGPARSLEVGLVLHSSLEFVSSGQRCQKPVLGVLLLSLQLSSLIANEL
jgi:hypothetical protein